MHRRATRQFSGVRHTGIEQDYPDLSGLHDQPRHLALLIDEGHGDRPMKSTGTHKVVDDLRHIMA
jgi:hypothetical protein